MDESTWLITLASWMAVSVKWWAIASGCLLVLLLLASRNTVRRSDDDGAPPLSPDGKA